MGSRKWVNRTHVILGKGKSRSLPEYQQWTNMRQRCKINGKYQTLNKSYIGCTHTREWESYDVWLEWAKGQVGFLCVGSEGNYYSMDKDILVKGNKVYSPDTCVFVPAELNTFLLNCKATRGVHPIGVHYRVRNGTSGKFVSQITIGGEGRKHLGHYETPEAAFQAYKIAKEAYAKVLANKYTGLVDDRVISALLEYEVNIED